MRLRASAIVLFVICLHDFIQIRDTKAVLHPWLVALDLLTKRVLQIRLSFKLLSIRKVVIKVRNLVCLFEFDKFLASGVFLRGGGSFA